MSCKDYNALSPAQHREGSDMKILEGITQGSDQWIAVRRGYLCASEAAAMLGYDKRTSRTELLRLKATGAEREFSDWVQKNLLDRGHEIEVFAREIAEALIGTELYPCTGTLEVDGLSLLASFDGIVIDESTVWECKSRNAELNAAMGDGDLPDSHWPQVEHQMLISGATRALFTTSDGTETGTVVLWYESKPARRAQLLAGWRQFAADVATYQHVEAIPAVVAAPIEDLPALTVELVGQVKNSNLVSFKAAVMARIQAINTDLQTDEDFATADKMVKFLDDGEGRLDLVKSQALAQTSSIDDLFRTIDALKGEMRAKRLTLNNLVKARKESIRFDIGRAGVDAAAAHLEMLNKRMGMKCMPSIPNDFSGVMKGRKTISSLRDAVNTELARFKITANETADRIQINLNALRELGAGHEFLFADVLQIILKANDDFAALCKNRIAEHKEKVAKKAEEAREQIRQEELAKIEAKRLAEEKKEAERLEAERKAAAPAQQVPAHQSPESLGRMFEPPVAKPAVTMVKGTVRPTDDAIIAAVAKAFQVDDSKALAWLSDMDLATARNKRAA